MKNKKSLVAIAAIFIITVIGVTFAYFNSSATFQNRFNLGNYNVVMQEVFESPENWSPGDTTPKIIKVKNEGTIDAAVRVSYTESWTDQNGDEVDSNDIPSDAVIINFTTPSDWTKNGDYYYYNYFLGNNEETTNLVESVTLNSNLGQSTCTEENGMQTCRSNVQGLAGYNYTLTFIIETVEYDRYQELWNTNQLIIEKPLIELPSNRTKDNLEVGDEICINGDTRECFNFVRYDGNDIVMISKWNLKVGDINEIRNYTMVGIGRYSSSDEGYGLQSSEVRGAVASGLWNGTLPFSATEYWYDGSNLKSKYGYSWDINDIYDTLYKVAPDFNGAGYRTTGYSIAYYVYNYERILEGYGVILKGARLLTYSEAVALGCDDSTQKCPTDGFVSNTTYWLGSAHDDDFVWLIDSGGNFLNGDINDYSSGVRPVVVISKSNL